MSTGPGSGEVTGSLVNNGAEVAAVRDWGTTSWLLWMVWLKVYGGRTPGGELNLELPPGGPRSRLSASY